MSGAQTFWEWSEETVTGTLILSRDLFCSNCGNGMEEDNGISGVTKVSLPYMFFCTCDA